MRRWLYAVARFMGDYNAVARGHVGRRLVNKAVGRKVVSRVWWK